MVNPDLISQFDFRFIAIDGAVGDTGYAIYYVSSGNFNFKLIKVGLIKTESGPEIPMRIRAILSEVATLAYDYSINAYFVELPPPTIYGWNIMSKSAIVGKAAHIYKTVGVAYSLIGTCNATGLPCRTIFPVEWQGKSTKGQSKATSIAKANDLIAKLSFKFRKLKTKEDANIADAINIGFHTIKQLHAGNWAMPNLRQDQNV